MFADAADRGLTAGGAEAAIDATGFDSRYASRRYVQRSGYKRFTRLRWPKLTVVWLTKSHLPAGAVPTRGSSQDSPQLPAAVRQAVRLVELGRRLGDAGYDAEHNHPLCRERLGVPHTVFALNRRNGGRRWPLAPYRRSMRRGFPRAVYNQRWQVESAFSRHKRRLSPFLRSRSGPGQRQESLLRVLTHNLMLLAAGPARMVSTGQYGFLALRPPSDPAQQRPRL